MQCLGSTLIPPPQELQVRTGRKRNRLGSAGHAAGRRTEEPKAGPSPAPTRPSSQLAPANTQPRLMHTEYQGLVPGSEVRLSEIFKRPTWPKEPGSQALTMILCRESKEHNRKPQRASLLRKVFCFVLTAPASWPPPHVGAPHPSLTQGSVLPSASPHG